MGVKASLWKAFRLAKDQNLEKIPTNLMLVGLPGVEINPAAAFAGYFSNKIKKKLSKKPMWTQMGSTMANVG